MSNSSIGTQQVHGTDAPTWRERTIAKLVENVQVVAAQAPITERTRLLSVVVTTLTPQQQNAITGKQLRDELVGLLVFIERVLPANDALFYGPELLRDAVELAHRISRGSAARDTTWQCIVLSLRAECLLLGGKRKEAKIAAGESEASYASITDPKDHVRQRHDFNRELLADGDTSAYAATSSYIQQLIEKVLAH